MPKELLIKGGHVVTVDPELGDLPVGDVLVADGVITAVGPDLAPATAGVEVVDAAGRLVIPGLVDTHRHVWQGAIGGYTPQITGAGYGPAVLTGTFRPCGLSCRQPPACRPSWSGTCGRSLASTC